MFKIRNSIERCYQQHLVTQYHTFFTDIINQDMIENVLKTRSMSRESISQEELSQIIRMGPEYTNTYDLLRTIDHYLAKRYLHRLDRMNRNFYLITNIPLREMIVIVRKKIYNILQTKIPTHIALKISNYIC